MTIRVLLTDDHAMLRQTLKAALDAEPGMSVAADAEDGRAAVRLARRHRFDVVIMDMMMAGLNGVDATRQILEVQPSTRVIGLSAHSGSASAQRMFQAGASGYVAKHDAVAQLIEAVRRVADGRLYVSPSVDHSVLQACADPDHDPGPNAKANGRTNGNGRRKAPTPGGNGHGNGKDHPAAHPPATACTADDLTNREREVLQLIAEGEATKTIAARLHLSTKTIETHRQHLMDKLDIHSIAELTKFAVREGLTDLEPVR